jgi:hypothetical protein
MDELNVLASSCGKDALRKFSIVITHMKPLKDREAENQKTISGIKLLGRSAHFS